MMFTRQRLGVIILFLSDLIILFLIFSVTVLIRTILPIVIPGYPLFSLNLEHFSWFFPVWIATLIYEGAYSAKLTFWDEVKLLWRVTLFSTIAILAIVVLGKMGIALSRTLIILIGLLSLVFFPLLRIGVKRLLFNSGILKSKVLILGAGEMGRLALRALLRERNLGYEVVGFVDDVIRKEAKTVEGVKVHEGLLQVDRYARNCDIQDIVIAMPELNKHTLYELVNRLQHKAKNILYFPDMTGMAVIGTELRHFFHDQVFALEIKNNLAQPINYAFKRFFDLLTGLILFIVCLIPVGFLVALIRMTSKGPAIFKQKRIGKNCRPFQCYKFRTMYVDAENRLMNILTIDPEAKKEWETYWKLKNDPRVTPLGKFLRKTSLDELPQLINVLKGEMSIVGPRPYLPREWEALKNHSEIIHGVHPGITGLWQVSGRSDSSYEQRLSLDSWYVRNWNLWLDIVILMKTVNVVLRKEGAR
jgi:Undecaprenyl-phosphate galactose phosphotransferase WbaP